MQTKLTLRINSEIIESAKKMAAKNGKSLSKIVEDYFFLLNKKSSVKLKEKTPVTDALSGSISGKGISEKEYKNYLEEKYL